MQGTRAGQALVPAALVALAALVAGLAMAGPAGAATAPGAPGDSAPGAQPPRKRVVIYYQTHYDKATGRYVSPLDLLRHRTGVTDVNVGAVHLNEGGIVHLNDDPPNSPKFVRMWSDLRAMQARGVKVHGMIGGAAQGTFERLDKQFDTYYPLLHNVISTYRLNGVDLDVEEHMSQRGIERLIDRLRKDFGPGFTITLTPVASALKGGKNISGFDYEKLYRSRGGAISWFNTQFYNGFGSLKDTRDYDDIVRRGVIPANKVVAGTPTHPKNSGGYVAPERLTATLTELTRRYPDFGGVFGWEYFNSLPGDRAAPWLWAAQVTAALHASAWVVPMPAQTQPLAQKGSN